MRFFAPKSPSVIVTISREYGAAALDVAHQLGELIGYPVVGEDFPRIAAVRLGMTPQEVVAVEDRSPSLAERILHNLGTAQPEAQTAVSQPSFESEVRKELENAVREAAQANDVIIVGGFANLVLRDRPDLLSVFLHASLSFRTSRIRNSLGMSAEEARKELERVDAARRRWGKLYYDLEWGSARFYDLTIDVSRFEVIGAAKLIAAAIAERLSRT